MFRLRPQEAPKLRPLKVQQTHSKTIKGAQLKASYRPKLEEDRNEGEKGGGREGIET